MKFSFVVSLYNCEKFILECINSLINQTYKDYEIIVIDDGSTDNSRRLIEDFITNNKIKYFYKENGGVSSARNFALNYITGDWIIFIDADDWINDNALDLIKSEIEENNQIDVILTDLYINQNELEMVDNKICNNFFVEEKEEIIYTTISLDYGDKIYEKSYSNCRCIGGKIYRSEFIKRYNISFNEKLVTFEDGLFNMYAYNYANKILCSNLKFYHYRQNELSLTHKYKENAYEYFKILFVEIIEFLKKYKYNTSMQPYYDCVLEAITCVITSGVENESNKKSLFIISQILDSEEYKCIIKNIDFKSLTKRKKIIMFFLKLKNKYIIYYFYKLKEIKNSLIKNRRF